ncbi:MAG: hypothetical protein RR205_02725 [Oscillospiraceae bacterium]
MTFFSAMLFAAVFFLMLTYSNAVSNGIGIGISICVETVIPSLFVFMVLASFLSFSPISKVISIPLAPITKYIFGLSSEFGCAILMSMIGGYPVGAKSIDQLYRTKQISSKQASFMLCFCCNPSPAFVIAGVGTAMLGNTRAGVVIYLSSIISSLVIGLLVKKNIKSTDIVRRQGDTLSFSSSIVSAMRNATSAIIIMCGFVLFFCSVIEIIRYLDVVSWLCNTLKLGTNTSQIVSSCIYGFLEVTGGCIECVKYSDFTRIILLPFFTSFAGLSVIFQIIAMFEDNDEISFLPFISSRFLHGIITVILSYPFLSKLLIATSVFSINSKPIPVANSNTPIFIICILCMCYMIFSGGNRIFLKKTYKSTKI